MSFTGRADKRIFAFTPGLLFHTPNRRPSGWANTGGPWATGILTIEEEGQGKERLGDSR